ncbi:hypothetical protein PZE06_20995 [Robertmurraya sp. DFI.2.37]|uniref:hypothetical protein n=1 Tax=Robertmurraya sp. DFI.2.37 TaxID=3031819 RepID=UPI001244D834|nr:hypothetical protein [Robertmurraya sp. DFI.2.37]MDF1510615.1 hypothetical protein [Robertmurraya sp. DFI.2.37]
MSKRMNLIGHKYGKLTVLKEVEQIGKERRFKCLCDCGNTTTVLMASLRSGNTKSCGCLTFAAKRIDLTGKKFGKLTVLKLSDKKANSGTYWDVICDCGNTSTVLGHNLRYGMTKTCGCLINIIGQKYGLLTVLEEIEPLGKTRKFKCRCECGNTPIIAMQNLRAGITKSCGCLRKKDVRKAYYRKINLEGQVFGELTVINESPERLRNEKAWVCLCSCGNKTLASRGQLLRGAKKSCGCLRKKTPSNALNLKGRNFGKLTVLERSGRTKNDNALWLCQCECGRTIKANATSLRRGEVVSCGCLKQEQMKNARKGLEDKTIDGVQVPLLTKKVRTDSKTGHKGVYKRLRRGKEVFEVSITIKGVRKYLGTFTDINKAIEARKEAELKYFLPYIKALEDNKDERNR